MKIRYNNSIQHFVDFNLYHSQHSQYYKSRFIFSLLAIPVMFSLFIVFTIIINRFEPVQTIILIIISIAWFAIAAHVIPKTESDDQTMLSEFISLLRNAVKSMGDPAV